jgi:hypothetical protein
MRDIESLKLRRMTAGALSLAAILCLPPGAWAEPPAEAGASSSSTASARPGKGAHHVYTPPGLPAEFKPRPVPTYSESGAVECYLVPIVKIGELNRDIAKVDAAKSAALSLQDRVKRSEEVLQARKLEVDGLQSQVDALAQSLEERRPLVKARSAQVDEFNADVQKHNALLGDLNEHVNAVNVLVEPHNTLVAEANSSADTANQLVDAYNTKLRRYGTKVQPSRCQP